MPVLHKSLCIFLAGFYDYQYRMRALDAIRDTGKLPCCWFLVCNCTVLYYYFPNNFPTDLPFHELGGTSTAVTGKRFRTWLLQLRNSHCTFQDSQSSLIDTVLDGYNKARHGAEVSVSLCVSVSEMFHSTYSA